MDKFIIPPRLKNGDVVGIVSPSKAPIKNDIVAQRTKNAVSFLESLGLKVKFAPHVYDNELFNGATVKNRVNDIHQMFLDPEVKMIMMICGGQYTNLIIDKIDYNLIKNNPKFFSGFSDGTLLTNAIFKNCGMQAYYGINLNDGLGFGISPKTKQNFIDTFMDNKPITITENKELIFTDWATGKVINNGYNGWKIIKEGTAEGILTGGLLQRLISTDYAGYEIDYNNRILFFECTFDAKNIAILLSSMKQKGIFDKIKGMIIGYCSIVEDQNEVIEIVNFLTREYSFPIIQIGELGHNVESYSLPIGAKAFINTQDRKIIISNDIDAQTY